MPKIESYDITTGMGKLHDGSKLPFLSEAELEEFNSIGYSSKKLDGTPCNRQEYLNSLGKGTFQVNQTKRDNGDFSEEFQIIRVTEGTMLTGSEVLEICLDALDVAMDRATSKEEEERILEAKEILPKIVKR